MRILLSVSVTVLLSVAHCLSDLQLCSSDSVSFCYERTYAAEVDLQTLHVVGPMKC